MRTSYIGADVDCKMTELAIETRPGQILRHRVPTTIPSIRQVLAEVPGRKILTFEEGPMAQWLYRNLTPSVDQIVVCDPRRNHLIVDDGDKADPIDAAKLVELLRGRHLRAVYHSDDDERVNFKEWVSLYYDRMSSAVAQVNKIRARCRMHGVRAPRGAMKNQQIFDLWIAELGDHPVAGQLQLLWIGLKAARQQAQVARRTMSRSAQAYPIIAAWQQLPGVGPVRAVTLFAYLDTPWRFASPKKLWKYCGVGLQRFASGTDKNGRPRPGRLKLAYRVNRRLKNVVVGAALSAIRQGDNVFAEYHGRLLAKGMHAANAWHTVARKMLSVMWGMWKTSNRFDPSLLG